MTQRIKHQLIPESLILTNAEIRNTKLNEAFFETVSSEQQNLNRLFASFRLWPNTSYCASCNNSQRTLKKSNKHIDGHFWHCNTCKKGASLRSNSFFENSRLSLKLILKILNKYMAKVEYVQMAFDLEVSRITISGYCDLFREAICYYIEIHSTRIGGIDNEGNQKIVEIDESLFFRRKYNRGRIQNEQWYIGGIERGTRNVFIVPVPNRNAQTITHVICENVLPGSKIITDQWRAYNAALEILPEYSHRSINHSLHFIDPNDSTIHTQNVEGLWSRSKYFLRKKAGIGLEEQSKYLIQFIWEYNTTRFTRLNELLILIQFNENN